MSRLPTPTTNKSFTAPRTHIPLKPLNPIIETSVTPSKPTHHLTSPPRPSRRPKRPVSQLTSSPATPSRPQPPRPALTLRIPHAPLPLLTYPSLPPCTAPSCPIIPLHAQGPYQHAGEPNTHPHELFGRSNPPPEVWEAWGRFLLKAEGEREGGEDDEDEGVVLAFLEAHGDERWMYEGGCGFFDGRGGGGDEESAVGGVRLSAGDSGEGGVGFEMF